MSFTNKNKSYDILIFFLVAISSSKSSSFYNLICNKCVID